MSNLGWFYLSLSRRIYDNFYKLRKFFKNFNLYLGGVKKILFLVFLLFLVFRYFLLVVVVVVILKKSALPFRLDFPVPCNFYILSEKNESSHSGIVGKANCYDDDNDDAINDD